MNNPIPPERFVNLVPSSKSAPPKVSSRSQRPWTITVQRRDRSGRWNQVASWIVTTDEEDMAGPLCMGLKPNYRVLINEGKPPPEDVPP